MSAEEVLVQIAEPIEMLEENYTLLPYIKVDDESMMVLNEEIYEEQVTDEPVLCVPMPDSLFDCNIEADMIEEHVESGDFLSEHNYHTITGEDSEHHADLYLDELIENKDSSKLKCPLCHKVMKATDTFYRHLRIHSGEKPYQCELCDKKFSQQSNLWKHVLIHTGERRFECPHCNKKFSQRANMQKHMMVHTGEKPFECFICGRTFTQRANLNKHIRIHTGEKPYSCKYCNRQFAQQSNMQKHELLHEGLKPFVCMICTAAFTQQSNLKKHIETHSGVVKTYKSGGKPYDLLKSFSCLICRRMYDTRRNLFRHMEQCTGEFSEIDESAVVELENMASVSDVIYFDQSCNVKLEVEVLDN